MVLASPQLGRNNHQPLSRNPLFSSDYSAPNFQAHLAHNNSHAPSIWANHQDIGAREGGTFHAGPSAVRMTENRTQDHFWTNLFTSNQLSNSTPVLNQQGSDLAKSRQQRMIGGHQLGNPSTTDFSGVQPNDGSQGQSSNSHQHPLAQTNSSPPSCAISLQQQQQNQQNQQQKNPKLYKTELCRSWVDTGRCNYGERCQYAHGDNEKRPIPRHPKYKTEACQSYHKTGYCPYGPRCHFIHNEEPHVLAGLVAASTNGSSASTPTGNATPANGSNPNLMMLRQINSLGNMASGGSSSSSPATPQHIPPNMRMPPPTSHAPPPYFQQPQHHQPLTVTQSWCIAPTNNNQALAGRGSIPFADPSNFFAANGHHHSPAQQLVGAQQQLFNGTQNHQQLMRQQQQPVQSGSFFSAPIASSNTANNTNSSIGSSSDGGDSSPTSSLPSSSAGDSGTESPSLGSGSFSPGISMDAAGEMTHLSRLSPNSFRTSLILINGAEKAQLQGQSISPGGVGPESVLPSNQQKVGLGAAVTQLAFLPVVPGQIDEQSLSRLAKNFEVSLSLPINQETPEEECLRRASGSSLGSVGNCAGQLDTPMSTTSSSSANITNNSSATSSDAETWSTVGRQQQIRLPVFERLSNGPF